MGYPDESPESQFIRQVTALSGEQAALWFWSGLEDIADAAAVHRDEDLYLAVRKMAIAALSQGMPLSSCSPEYVSCPACHAYTGQNCINLPGRMLQDKLHPERVERVRKLCELMGVEA
ncbi:hypothetical protein [Micromonospora sp. HK10]|uniref:zinc finger domain-containing protein n=1 Tax=Micromonospora sp. HK10 TaxID=1538294 RepID=UPI0006270498|nr:hypothetical protein [Micromonospora sp. HK10]KKK07279.1 hypothetical protein LQ51_03525 [Micromonospora sp. HK10]